jgi:hypothetical protein
VEFNYRKQPPFGDIISHFKSFHTRFTHHVRRLKVRMLDGICHDPRCRLAYQTWAINAFYPGPPTELRLIDIKHVKKSLTNINNKLNQRGKAKAK